MINFFKEKRNIGTLIILFLIMLSWIGALDRHADNYTNEAIVEAGSAYAVARSINAVISMLQTSTIGVKMGLEGSITIGELLDPVNDLIERFSLVMTIVLSSLMLQKTLLLIAANKIFSIILTISGIISVYIIRQYKHETIPLILKLFIVFFVIKFSLGIVILLNSTVDYIFLSSQIQESSSKFNDFQKEIKNLQNGSNISSHDLLKIQDSINNDTKRLEDIINNEIPLLKNKIDIVNSELANAHIEYDKIKNETGWTKRLTSEKIKNSREKISTLNHEKKNIENQIKEKEKSIRNLEKSISLKNSQTNGNKDDISAIINKFKNLKKTLSIRSIEEKVSASVDNVIKLLILFVLKTILIPLLFFYLFVTLVKLVWKMDFKNIPGATNTAIA